MSYKYFNSISIGHEKQILFGYLIVCVNKRHVLFLNAFVIWHKGILAVLLTLKSSLSITYTFSIFPFLYLLQDSITCYFYFNELFGTH